MLRNLRSRRRSRCGGLLCAVLSALLLLTSLSLLRSHTHRRFTSHSVNYDSLLSDSSNEDTTGGEDTIDALDIIEEQQTQESTADAEEDDEPMEETNKASGYFFYHVEGVIRRSFSKKSMMMEESNKGVKIFEATMEDKEKTAFGSDDVAVDEGVRMKMMEVKGIEDALLLKVGKKVSPLREGWGDWFDKKSDFLRKDKMLRSNLEGLNPLHNPVLQDPDNVGLTGLTKVDKLLHKSLLNEFKKVPFPSRKISREPKLAA